MDSKMLVCPLCGYEVTEEYTIDSSYPVWACQNEKCYNVRVVLDPDTLPTLEEWIERQR